MRLTRRDWIRLASSCGAAQLLVPRMFGQQAAASKPLFAEVPPSASGITWVHDNGLSELHYLPETMGPWCAFLDFDNDGWMDIFLVNSGPSDFW